MAHVHKISVVFTHSLCYSYLHFTWGTIFTLCLTMLQYIIVHISTSLLSLEIGACFKGLQEPEHSLKHKLILLLWMRLWLKEWVVWVMGYSPLWEQDLASGYAGAFTTWNTSTTLSVLQRSMVVAMAQNMPDLLTVSLERDTGSSCVGSDGCWPAVDHNGFVVSPSAPCTPPTAAGLRQLMIWWVSLWAVIIV